MRFLFRWAFRLFLVVVVLLVAAVLLKDAVLKSVAEKRLRHETGLNVKLGKLEVGLLSPTLNVENLRIYNTPEFGGAPLVDIPELFLECDLPPLGSRKLRFNLVRLNLAEFNVVENASGRTNIATLLTKIEQLASTNTHHKVAGKFEFAGIETLNLTLGKINYRSIKRPAQNAEFALGLRNEIVTNVQSWADLSSAVLTILLNRGITFVSLPASPSMPVNARDRTPVRAPEQRK